MSCGTSLGRRLVGLAVVAVVAAGASAGGAQEDEDAAAVRQAKSLARAFRSAARTVLPTVVKIQTTSAPKRPSEQGDRNPLRGTPWEDLFGGEPPQRDQGQESLGSGVIIDPSGIVLTNNHVIEGADAVVVQMADGREFKASDIKADPQSDLAVLRIKAADPFPAARLGDSDAMEIGDWVIAVGHPFELEFAVSAGIISAKGRSLAPVSRANFLQTDAAINPGNSGGPLVNLDGEVVGINTAIFSRTGGYQGIGFAIPANLAQWVTSQLVSQGTVKRAYLGVSMEQLTAERAGPLGVPPHGGVVIEQVFNDSPAMKAGLQSDDVVVSFDGQLVSTPSDLQQLVERAKVGSSHRVEIVRKGKPQTVQVVVFEMPSDFGVSRGLVGGSKRFYSEKLGMVAVELNPELAERYGFKGMSGVFVYHVDADRPAHRSGIRIGMLVRKVGGQDIQTVDDFRKATEKASVAAGIAMEVQTTTGARTITVK